MKKLSTKISKINLLTKIVVSIFCYGSSLTNNAQELIQDRNFQQGFYVRNRTSVYQYDGPISCEPGLPAPVWNTAEWHSKTSVLNMTPVSLSDGMCAWADNNKDFRFGPIGAQDYQLYFAVNSYNEYDSVYRVLGQEWPHLFIEQQLSAPYDFPGQGPGCPSFSILDSLVFQIEAKLIYNQTIIQQGYDPSKHAAQFLVYFYVKNSNPNSSGYGKYVWLGVPLYDDRFPVLPGQVSYDIGTQTLINSIASTDFASESMHNGTWVHAQLDLLPYATAALDTAWVHGFLNQSTDLADYKIGGIVIGWELPGMNIATVGIRGLSLFAYPSTTTGMNREKITHSLNVYPNPVTDLATIEFELVKPDFIKVAVFNSLGQEVALLSSEFKQAGTTTLHWDSKNNPAGLYHYSIQTSNDIVTQNFIVKKQ